MKPRASNIPQPQTETGWQRFLRERKEAQRGKASPPAASLPAPTGTRTNAAEARLRALLRGAGPSGMLSRDAVRVMAAEGFTHKVIRRARERLGVVVNRSGFGAAMVSTWMLPVPPR